jgi:3-oxoacyl-[acyl-carrier-protein] synthase II
MVTPLGIRLEEIWERLLAGASGVTPVHLFDAEGLPVAGAGQVSDDDWSEIRARFPDEAGAQGERRTLFALAAAEAALEDAKLLRGPVDPWRAGVSLAAGVGLCRLEDIARWTAEGRFDQTAFARGLGRLHPASPIRNPADRATALLAHRFALRGPSVTITSACAAATQAIGLAFRRIRRGEVDVVLAGGADSMVSELGIIAFCLLGAASTVPGPPGDLARPFDRKRSGLVVGEGAGIAVLEEEGHARGRGARIYAEVVGYGASIDAFRVTAPHPDGRGATQAMRAALLDAGMTPDQCDYVNAHGTGTKLNDPAETAAIKAVFQEHARRIAVSSTKSMIGHLIAAAGGPEFAATVLTVERDEIHPTRNLATPDPKCDLDYVANRARRATVRAALSNSFGFGGQNASIVVRKYREGS